MAWRFLSRLALALGIIASGAQPAGSQQLDSLSIGFRKPAAGFVSSGRAPVPSTFSLGRASVESALVGALWAGLAGLAVDAVYCDKHHGDEPSILFGPCSFYVAGGTAVGGFGGAVVGATIGAVRVARRRGCPSGAAVTRAIAGAVLGAAPGLITVASRPRYSPGRTALVLSAPLLAGVGAAAAVVGCRAPQVLTPG